MASNPSLVVKIGANIEALKAALQLGQTELIKTAAGAQALAGSFSGQKLEQNALQMAVAIKSVGGAAALTTAEAKKADAAFQAWMEKAAKTGKEIPPELAKIAKETSLIANESAKLEKQATLTATAIKNLGGAASLTVAEAKKADQTFSAWLATAAKTGQQVTPEMAKLAAETKKVAEESKKAEENAGSFFAKLAGGVAVGTLVADALKSIGTAALGALQDAAMALPNMINKAIELGGSLFDMSLKTGASVENLSRLRYVSSQTGISMETFTNSMYKMQVALGKSGSEAKETQKALNALGLDMTTLKNSKPDEAFITIMSGLEKIPNRADQARVGMALFSKGFKDMAGLTQESITELMAAADELGLVYSAEFASAADIAGDAIARLKMQWESLTIRIGSAFLPAVIGLAESLSQAFSGAVSDANKKLGEMGGSDGFLDTVRKAMGTGNEALAAQIKLYEALRDAIVSFVRGAVIPAIKAVADLMILFNASKVVFGDVAQAIAFVGLGFKVASLAVAEFGSFISRGAMWGDDVKRIKTELGAMTKAIEERGKALQQYKKNEDWWADGAKTAVAEVEAAMDRFASSQVDIAKVITENAKIAREASGGMSTGITDAAASAEEAAKALKTVTDEAGKLETTWRTLSSQGATAEQVFAAVGSGAAGLQAKFAALGQAVPADVQKMVDAVRALGMSINITKWLEQQRADIRKVLEASAKDTEALVAKQRESINKGFIGNLDVVIRMETETTAAKARAIDDRIALIKEEMADAKDIYGRGYRALQDELKRLEEQRYRDQVAAIKKQYDAIRAGLDKNASTYKMALDAIGKAEKAALDEAARTWAKRMEELYKSAQGPVQKIAAVFTMLGDVFDNINSKVGQTLQVLGGAFKVIGDSGKGMGEKLIAGFSAASAVIQQFAAGSVLAAAATGALSGAAAGASLAMMLNVQVMGPLGLAIIGVSAAIGGLIGAWQSLQAQERAAAASAEQAAKQLAVLKDKLMDLVGTEDDLKRLAEAIGAVPTGIEKWNEATKKWDPIMMSFADRLKAIENSALSADMKLQAYAKTLEEMQDHINNLLKTVTTGTKLASQELLDFMKVAITTSGSLAEQAKEFSKAWTSAAATGLTAMFAGLQTGATKLAQAAAIALHRAAGMSEADAKKAAEGITGIFVKTQAQATGLGASIAATFAKMIENGASFREALDAIKGPLDTLRKQLEMTGLKGGAAFENLSRMGQIASGEITGPLFDAVMGATQALQGLHNSGLLNQEMFSGIASSAMEAYHQILAQGVDGQAALQMMQPTLQTIWELQQKFGYEVDDATQALIDEAVAAGDVGAAHMSAADQTAAAMNRVVTVLEAMATFMGVTLPASAAAGAKKIDESFAKVDITIEEPWKLWDPPPEVVIPYSFEPTGEPPPGMAAGGIVYAASGIEVAEPLWRTKGSDIVPAMLTPGERVLTTGQNYDYEHRMRTNGAAPESPVNVAITIQALDPAGLKQVVEKEVGPLLVSAFRRNVNGLRTETRKELVE